MTELADILGPSLEIIANKLSLSATLQKRAQNTNAEYHVKNYGAVCDGTTDDSVAVLAAIAAAEVTGGVVMLPAGRIRLRQTLTLRNTWRSDIGSDEGRKTVSIRGAGMYQTKIVWDPSNVADDCIRAQSFVSGVLAFCQGGDISDLSIVNEAQTCSGNGILIDSSFRFSVRNVSVSLFRGGSGFDGILTNRGGTGIKVYSSGAEDDGTNQHLHVENVEVYGCYTSWDIANSVVMTVLKGGVDGGPAYIRDGCQIDWYTGSYQGGTMFVLAPVAGNSIEFSLHGGWMETNASGVWTRSIKALAPTDLSGFGGHISIYDLHASSGTQYFIDIDSYALALQTRMKTGGGVGDVGIKARNSRLQIEGAGWSGFMGHLDTAWDLDAATIRNTTWIDAGNISIGTASPSSSLGTSSVLTLGGALGLAKLTHTQREALSLKSEGDVIWNDTANAAQFYTGSKWRSLRDASVKDLLGSNLKAYFDARYGIVDSTHWASLASAHVLAATNSPTYGADPGYFGGRSVWKFIRASSQYMDSGSSSPQVWAVNATGFYAFMVVRLPVLTDAGMRWMIVSDNNPSAAAPWQFYNDSTGGLVKFNINQNAGETVTNTVDTSVHFIEFIAPGNSAMTLDVDGVAGVGGPMNPLALVSERIYVGGTPLYSASSTMNVAAIGFATTPPSADVRAALLEMHREVYEF
jgi:hypothetical protein